MKPHPEGVGGRLKMDRVPILFTTHTNTCRQDGISLFSIQESLSSPAVALSRLPDRDGQSISALRASGWIRRCFKQ